MCRNAVMSKEESSIHLKAASSRKLFISIDSSWLILPYVVHRQNAMINIIITCKPFSLPLCGGSLLYMSSNVKMYILRTIWLFQHLEIGDKPLCLSHAWGFYVACKYTFEF